MTGTATCFAWAMATLRASQLAVYCWCFSCISIGFLEKLYLRCEQTRNWVNEFFLVEMRMSVESARSSLAVHAYQQVLAKTVLITSLHMNQELQISYTCSHACSFHSALCSTMQCALRQDLLVLCSVH